jgi:hypothetical protein
MSTTIDTTIPKLLEYFRKKYGPETNRYANLDSDCRDIVDACINCLVNNVHPVNAISSIALNHLKNYTSFDFNEYTCKDSYDSFFTADVTVEEQPVSISLKEFVPSNACCKYYSFENNISQEYAYANLVNSPTCSNEKINTHFCNYSLFQKKCPFYVADHKIFTTHTLFKDDKEYSYVSYITRTENSNTNISIYDGQENLLNELVYSYSEIAEIGLEKIKDEITSIVSTIHQSAFIDDNPSFDFIDHTTLLKEIDPSNSYISSLIK